MDRISIRIYDEKSSAIVRDPQLVAKKRYFKGDDGLTISRNQTNYR